MFAPRFARANFSTHQAVSALQCLHRLEKKGRLHTGRARATKALRRQAKEDCFIVRMFSLRPSSRLLMGYMYVCTLFYDRLLVYAGLPLMTSVSQTQQHGQADAGVAVIWCPMRRLGSSSATCSQQKMSQYMSSGGWRPWHQDLPPDHQQQQQQLRYVASPQLDVYRHLEAYQREEQQQQQLQIQWPQHVVPGQRRQSVQQQQPMAFSRQAVQQQQQLRRVPSLQLDIYHYSQAHQPEEQQQQLRWQQQAVPSQRRHSVQEQQQVAFLHQQQQQLRRVPSLHLDVCQYSQVPQREEQQQQLRQQHRIVPGQRQQSVQGQQQQQQQTAFLHPSVLPSVRTPQPHASSSFDDHQTFPAREREQQQQVTFLPQFVLLSHKQQQHQRFSAFHKQQPSAVSSAPQQPQSSPASAPAAYVSEQQQRYVTAASPGRSPPLCELYDSACGAYHGGPRSHASAAGAASPARQEHSSFSSITLVRSGSQTGKLSLSSSSSSRPSSGYVYLREGGLSETPNITPVYACTGALRRTTVAAAASAVSAASAPGGNIAAFRSCSSHVVIAAASSSSSRKDVARVPISTGIAAPGAALTAATTANSPSAALQQKGNPCNKGKMRDQEEQQERAGLHQQQQAALHQQQQAALQQQRPQPPRQTHHLQPCNKEKMSGERQQQQTVAQQQQQQQAALQQQPHQLAVPQSHQQQAVLQQQLRLGQCKSGEVQVQQP
ncbi:unnamed protein product [Rangifer tarandus platyrhynchus]|uniref:Uncharacterized protein n=1 Tax=Rangifer tarandus platyrhynchus TaxID=3082113 RepID=A0ABN8XJQ1_RANTA|nr:unnamed protein product [Rangifer tarandus platyrhynchus]